MNIDRVRFEAEFDQLKAKMVNEIAANGEEWFFAVDAACLQAVKNENSLIAAMARFAKIGMYEVLRSYESVDDTESPA